MDSSMRDNRASWLIVTLIKPIISLTNSITKLDVTMTDLKEIVEKNELTNLSEHKELKNKNVKQDSRLDNHETRITYLKKGNKK